MAGDDEPLSPRDEPLAPGRSVDAAAEAPSRLSRRLTPMLVLVLGVGLTLAIVSMVERLRTDEERVGFFRLVGEARDLIDRRMAVHTALLEGAAGLFAANESVTRREFAAFVERLDLRTQYPGVRGIGFSLCSTSAELPALVERMREEGFSEFAPWPDGEREEYHTIVLLEPLDARNRAALGYDMFQDLTRRLAMVAARDGGVPAASGRVELVQEISGPKQSGFLVYLPVYRGGVVPTSVDQRRAKLLGFVYSPFRADDLLRGVFGADPAVDIEVFDGLEPVATALMHASRRTRGDSPVADEAPRFEAIERVRIARRDWTIRFLSRGREGMPGQALLPTLLTVTGSLVSAFLAWLTFLQTRARDNAERSAHLLLIERERFRTTLGSVGEAVVATDTLGRITFMNAIAERLTGQRAESAIGEPFESVVRLVWAEGGQPLPPPLVRLRERLRGTRPIEATTSASLLLRSDGERIPIDESIAAILDDRGGLIGTVAALRDMTDRARLLASERVAREEAERASRLKDEFVATLSHELRTPLNAMLGWTHLLRRRQGDPTAVGEAIEVIERNARSQVRMVEDLLDMTRILAGKVRLDPVPCEPRALIDAAIAAVAPQAQAKGLSVGVEIDASVDAFFADPTRLQQIVTNLLSNAIKFTPERGTVSVTARRLFRGERAWDVIRVSDTGIGIAPEFLPHVFDRFRQADASTTRRYGGLGLGLSIVRQLVELHGGRASAESDGPGRGARFTVEFPARADAARAAQGGASDEDPIESPDGVTLEGLRVLVVDDEADAREYARAILSGEGAIVATAAGADEALAMLPGLLPCVVVSDIGMPDRDGYDLIRSIRRLPAERGGRTPAAALTAFARVEDRRRALDAGYQLHTAKPVEPLELVALVASLGVLLRQTGA
jgi:PAS domain S-box-containing protein